MWCNFYVNNDSMLIKRKQEIENYLNYIDNHPYLKFNQTFRIFISENFDRYKSEKVIKNSLFDKLGSLKSYLPQLLVSKYYSTLHLYRNQNITSFNNDELDKDKDNLLRLEKGILDLKEFLDKYAANLSKRTEAIKQIYLQTKKLKDLSFKFDDSNHSIKNDDKNYILNSFEHNFNTFSTMNDKLQFYNSVVSQNTKETLEVLFYLILKEYIKEVTSLKDIFYRKELYEKDLLQTERGS